MQLLQRLLLLDPFPKLRAAEVRQWVAPHRLKPSRIALFRHGKMPIAVSLEEAEVLLNMPEALPVLVVVLPLAVP
jgi:hypothetical protein